MALLPTILSYVLSYVFLGIYWNNHHHMLQAARKVDGAVLWANLHLLFWLSLVPFVTAWMGQTRFSKVIVAFYGLVLLLSGIAYYILSLQLIRVNGRDSVLAKAVGNDIKGKVSIVIYAAAIPFALVSSGIACAFYVTVAIMWLVPDIRIERHLKS